MSRGNMLIMLSLGRRFGRVHNVCYVHCPHWRRVIVSETLRSNITIPQAPFVLQVVTDLREPIFHCRLPLFLAELEVNG